MTMTPAAGSTALRAEVAQGPTQTETAATGRSTAEALKANSGYLHGPLSREVLSAAESEAVPGFSVDHFSKDAVSILKFHGSYQQFDRDKQAQQKGRDWEMMLRLRSPAGRIAAPLFLALDDLCERYGNGTLRATTRQAFQMHGVSKQDLPEVIGAIVRSMGSTLAACGDINRNVMAPAAPFQHGGYPAARQLAVDIADLLTPEYEWAFCQ